MYSALRTLSAVLFLVTTTASAAVPGEVIAAFDVFSGRYAVMSATNGGNFVEVTCGGDLTHLGSPRYFLTARGGTIVLPDTFLNSELVASDEDCTKTVVISNSPGTRFSNSPHWSPDGSQIAVYGISFDLESGTQIEQGIYVADVVRGNAADPGRPTGIANIHLIIATLGEVMISWSGDSQRIAYVAGAPNGSGGQQGDIFVYDLISGTSVNVTNTPNLIEDQPSYSPADERIAFIRLVGVRGSYRYDIFTIPAWGGSAFQVTSKATSGKPQNKFPCFSPDGLNLSFSSGDSLYASHIYRIKADGSGKAVNLTAKRAGSFSYNVWRR